MEPSVDWTNSRRPNYGDHGNALVGIRDGSFAREWAADQQQGYPRSLAYQRRLSDSPFGKVEREVLMEVAQATEGKSPSLAASS